MNEKIARLAARRRGRRRGCPICGKPVAEKFRPFCSERCRRIDLDRWLGEAYRVPGEETSEKDGDTREDQ
jgi:uncharacterized protein